MYSLLSRSGSPTVRTEFLVTGGCASRVELPEIDSREIDPKPRAPPRNP
jgi:hypothetical protein